MTPSPAADAPTVLIVDDDPQLRSVTSIILGAPDRTLVAVENADDALAHVRTRGAAVVVADFQMPGKSGLDLFVALRAEGFGMPFILLSGDAHARSAVAERANDMYAVLTKPVSPMTLRRIVGEALAGKAPA